MLELGADAPLLHASLKDAVDDAGIDLIFACGPHMKGLYDALPASKKGGYALTSSSLEDTVVASLRHGDVIVVKASNGTRLGPIVAALKSRFGNESSVS
jgi:UDP-N-acetylmuramoyl-tripeptide--D-alanyl-D-alanine ligase